MLILECKQGELQNGKMIVVKKFNFKQLTNPDVQKKLFMNEVFPLTSPKHPNIVRCVGYCSEKSNEVVKHNGIFVLAESQPEMLLCLEYLTMGSLDKHLKDESSGLDWRTCYKIIKGVCCGLHYLHEECRPQNNNAFIIHLDLKPANILLDENMVPKVADFSLSKLLCDKKTQTCPVEGTLGYMAPEYISEGKITTKADIYSLGVVIIEIITGSKADLSNPDIEHEEGIIMKIKEHVEKLCEKSREVRDKIELAEGNGMVATDKIETWLARADTIIFEGMAVCESKQIGLN
ncbi:probable serine/threonine-protein kinase PBL7 [Miscanthus floridulus]|uniref:probable serine/threonine-protein kinase PBL7 n=1 Tax=Miscanthus floridulus TaxID=154761 RepID=UPI00345B2C3C